MKLLITILLLSLNCSFAGVNIMGQIKLEAKTEGGNAVGLKDAVIWVEIPGHQPKRKPRLESMTQKDKKFSPRVMVAPVNTEVFFPNKDEIFHSVFSYNKVKKLDLGKFKGDGPAVIFEQAGIYPIGCEIHPGMSATIVIVNTPFFAKSSATGSFSIRDVKPGDYTFHLWGDNLKKQLTKTFTIKDGLNKLEWVVSQDNVKRRKKKRKKSNKGKKKRRGYY